MIADESVTADGRWRWDGGEWRPVAPPPDGFAFTGDGRWSWDGTEWERLAIAVLRCPHCGSTTYAGEACIACGRSLDAGAPRRASRGKRFARGAAFVWPRAALGIVAILALAMIILVQDDASLADQARDGRTQVAALHGDLALSQSHAADLQSQVSTLRTQLAHPTLGIWNVSQTLDSPGAYLSGGVPDTFTYHLKATSTGPIAISILTFRQFASAVDCVDAGYGNTHYCMHHQGGLTWNDVTTIDFDFHDAEGCAGYLVVWTAAGRATVNPDVSVTYNPAPRATGICA